MLFFVHARFGKSRKLFLHLQRFMTKKTILPKTHRLPFLSYGEWMSKQFPFPVQKLSVDGGFTCPNRDGTLSTEGCIYCNNRSFTPDYCRTASSLTEQVEAGKCFFRRKHPDMRFLAYFQSYSNTYAHLSELQRIYEEVLSIEDVVGIVISTRPDCLSEPVLNYLEQLSHQTFLVLEIGVESTDDDILRKINRGHDVVCSIDAIQRAASHGLNVGIHLIIGLPDTDLDHTAEQTSLINSLPVTLLKLHQLQVIRDTPLADWYAERPFPLLTTERYLTFVADFIEHLRPDIVVERLLSQAPPDMVIAPQWNIKNHEFVHRLIRFMNERDMYQGHFWKRKDI